jgi:hypothetical protein
MSATGISLMHAGPNRGGSQARIDHAAHAGHAAPAAPDGDGVSRAHVNTTGTSRRWREQGTREHGHVTARIPLMQPISMELQDSLVRRLKVSPL